MRVYLKTFGCRANQADTETVRAMIEAAGGTIAAAPQLADVAVFNSCAVTAQAEADLRRSVRSASRANPRLRSVVMGCAASLDAAAIGKLPGVRDVVAASDFAAIAKALELPSGDGAVRVGRQSGTRALLRIQDGCDEHCTFCATRLARGRSRSVPPERLVEDARSLAELHSEIVLTGVHIGGYGQDIGSSLGSLVERLVAGTSGVRFRLSSIEATEVDERLVELFSDPRRLVPYLHAPLQSGSDAILRRMGRNWYDRRTYTAAIRRIVESRPVFGVGADVMAGFPGETDLDHALSLSLIEDLPFSSLHVFQYSPREGTAATRMDGAVDARVVARRAAELRAVSAAKREAYERSRIGTLADVIALEPSKKGERRGLTEDYLSVTLSVPHGRGDRFSAILAAGPTGLLAHTEEERAA